MVAMPVYFSDSSCGVKAIPRKRSAGEPGWISQEDCRAFSLGPEGVKDVRDLTSAPPAVRWMTSAFAQNVLSEQSVPMILEALHAAALYTLSKPGRRAVECHLRCHLRSTNLLTTSNHDWSSGILAGKGIFMITWLTMICYLPHLNN